MTAWKRLGPLLLMVASTSGCGEPKHSVGTGKPGEFSREAVERAAFPEKFESSGDPSDISKTGGRKAEVGKVK